jgi:hypothetical protein
LEQGIRELGQAAVTNRLGGDMRKAAEILEIPATITARGQITVPAAIRKMLGLGSGATGGAPYGTEREVQETSIKSS